MLDETDEAEVLFSVVRVSFVVEAKAPVHCHSFIGALTLLLRGVLASKAAVASSDIHSHQRQIAIFVFVKPHRPHANTGLSYGRSCNDGREVDLGRCWTLETDSIIGYYVLRMTRRTGLYRLHSLRRARG